MECPTAMKVSAGFGGGMGRMAHTCGVVTGVFMILGLKHGGEDTNAREKAYQMVREFACRIRGSARFASLQRLDGAKHQHPEGLAGHEGAKTPLWSLHGPSFGMQRSYWRRCCRQFPAPPIHSPCCGVVS